MIDEIAIQQTLNRWSEGGSREDWDQMASTLVPDAVWEAPGFGMKEVGIPAIIARLKVFVAPNEYAVQLNSPGLITVAGDTAVARTVIRESGKYAGRDVAFEGLGLYSDALVRTPEGWRFKRRTFEVRGVHTFALLPAAAAGSTR